MNPREFTLSKHAIERLRERHPHIAKEIDKLAGNEGTAIKKKHTYEFFYKSTEERGFLNDPRFMIMLHDKYGPKDYRIFVRDDVVFVGVKGDPNMIVTTLSRDTHTSRHVKHQQKKWKKQ
jgi:hypothetical protein